MKIEKLILFVCRTSEDKDVKLGSLVSGTVEKVTENLYQLMLVLRVISGALSILNT